jgi:hypothetical protein
MCRNHSLGFTTKARPCKGVGQKRSPGITFHVPENVGKCEGMNPPHSQVKSHFGNWSPNGLPNFHRMILRSKPIGLKTSLYHWKALGT